eukprot:6189862-Pleurochrysis_carterae.AAC.2
MPLRANKRRKRLLLSTNLMSTPFLEGILEGEGTRGAMCLHLPATRARAKSELSTRRRPPRAGARRASWHCGASSALQSCQMARRVRFTSIATARHHVVMVEVWMVISLT